MMERLKDPAPAGEDPRSGSERNAGNELVQPLHGDRIMGGHAARVASAPEHKQFEGKRMSEVIQALGGDPVDVLFKLLEANRMSIPTIYFHHSEQDMRYALQQPFVSIGSDGTAVKTEGPLARGNPHPRYYGTFPRVLGRYVRDEK